MTSSQILEPAVNIVERPSKNFSFLLKPSNFLPINQQEIPSPFHTPSTLTSTTSLTALLSSGHFAAAATLAATLLTSEPDPTNAGRILSLLQTRLTCLTLLGLTAQAAAESKCLQDLSAPFYREKGVHVVPWDLRILATRLQAIGFGDWRRGIMAFYEMAREARIAARRAEEENNAQERRMWEERLQDLGVRVANALVEIGDLDGAVRHMKTLRVEGSEEGKGLLRTRLAMVWLQIGDVEAARRCLAEGVLETETVEGEQDGRATLEALCAMANGNYDEAIKLWQDIAESAQNPSERAVAVQNIAVCLVYVGEATKVSRPFQCPHVFADGSC